MFNSSSKFNIKTIKQGDSDFHFSHDGFTLTPRASLEISSMCPSHMRMMIERALVDGYLKPVAYMKDTEYMWEKLGE
jgi:hypothetical protein